MIWSCKRDKFEVKMAYDPKIRGKSCLSYELAAYFELPVGITGTTAMSPPVNTAVHVDARTIDTQPDTNSYTNMSA